MKTADQPKPATRLLLIPGGDTLFLRRARRLLSASEFRIVGEAASASAILGQLIMHEPNLLLADLEADAQAMRGVDLLSSISWRGLKTRTVVHLAAANEKSLIDAIRIGARGVIVDPVVPFAFLDCLRAVAAGQDWIDGRIAACAFRLIARSMQDQRKSKSAPKHLTPREHEIARFVVAGFSNKAIARQMAISEGTVKMHLHNMYDKLQISGRTDLAVYVKSMTPP